MLRFDTEAEIWPISSLVLLGLRWSLFCCNPVVLFLDNGKVLRCNYTILKTEIYEKTEWIITTVRVNPVNCLKLCSWQNDISRVALSYIRGKPQNTEVTFLRFFCVKFKYEG